ncbi:MAG: glycosyltransferase family 4 protein [Cytophagaceae bacterium]
MKILIIGPFPPTINGVTISNDFLRRWLQNHGDQVSCVNTETGNISTEQGKKGRTRKAFRFMWLYRNVFKAAGKDVVYITIGQTFFGIMKYLPFIWWSKMLGVPYVLHVHGGYLKTSYESMPSWQQHFIKNIIVQSSALIALSDSLAKQLKSIFPSAPIQVVENFYDRALIDQQRKPRKEGPVRFIYLSNLMVGKGIVEFLEALHVLKDKGKQFTVAIAGGVEKGLDRTIQDKLAPIKDYVTFLGLADFDKKKELLYSSDVFVLPTWYVMEGQPISMIEAYVTGNWVVSTDQGGIPDVSGYPAFVKCPKQDSLGLAQVLEQVMDKSMGNAWETNETMATTRERFHPDRFGMEVRSILNGEKAPKYVTVKMQQVKGEILN